MLPFVGLLLSGLAFANRETETNWGRGFLRGTVLWGLAAVCLVELLSLFNAIRPVVLGAGWLLLIVLAIFALVRSRKVSGRDRLVPFALPQQTLGRVALAAVLTIVLVTGVVAWIAPPNTWDSLNYHMSRVAHWAQQGSVRHYATGIEIQNNMPPAAEMLVLHTYVLAGSDRLVNFVQWSAMLVSLLGVGVLAGQLGARRGGQWMSVVFAATLPMGIVQASSTQTDYVVGMWVLAGAVEALAIWRGGSESRSSPVFLGLTLGLAVLAKPTAYAYVVPLALLAVLGITRRSGVVDPLRTGLVIGGLALALNLGQFARNIATYGHPVSSPARIDEHRTALLGGRGAVSNLLRNAALHAGTPSPHVNKALALAVHAIHDLMSLDINDPGTTSTGEFKVSRPTTNENRAGNPLHAWLALPAIAIVLVQRQFRLQRTYAVVVLSTFLLFSLLFKWQLFGSRYHLPFFLLMAPLLGTVFHRLARPWLRMALVVGATAACLPWLLSIDSRSLLPRQGRADLLSASRQTMYFANAPYLQQPYEEMATLLRNAACGEVGLALVGGGLEYPLWVLLGAPDRGVALHWIVAGTPSAVYRDVSNAPCGVICQHCPDQPQYAGLPFTYRMTEFTLYLESGD